MCSLCGVLGGRGHWTESSANPEAFAGNDVTRRRERQSRTRLANRVLSHYGLSLSDWSGHAYVLRTRTGRTAMVDSLGALWASAEALLGAPCDPLDESLIAALGREQG